MTADEKAAAALLKKKPKPKPEKPKKPPELVERDDLNSRAAQWAKLHDNPKTRIKMDEQLDGLTEAQARRVILNGQRIACGLAPKY